MLVQSCILIIIFFQFCFVARKKFNHLSFLHVFHHGTVAMSTYPGVRWLPGGHSTFWGLLNSLVHVFMYSYYFMAALGPEYSKYVWWKTHITKMQMIQFVLIFIHEFQLFYKNDCVSVVNFILYTSTDKHNREWVCSIKFVML